jgi:two-component system osmolarity sensor histidine kinase EnvZ
MRLALGMLSEKPDVDLVERLVRDVDAMNELIARCLELGRDVSAREAVDLDLAALLAELAAAHAPGDAEVRWRPHAECRLRAPPLALRRVVSNLLDNAVRYGGGQPVDIELRCAADAVEVQVLDRGPGIPEAEREAVFQPFHRLEASRSRRTGGSGLGLAIVRQIADANGWSVTLGPRAGGGTAACLRLPLAATMAARRHPWST